LRSRLRMWVQRQRRRAQCVKQFATRGDRPLCKTSTGDFGSARIPGGSQAYKTSITGARMPKYVIERDIPNAGKLTQQELQGISQKSCGVLQKLGPQVQWLESFVTDDKIYCIYIAPNEEMVREHARQGGFPANRISAVRSVISPTTAEG
jgi:hypothetical protein